jgi:hypothetical protein
MQPQGLGPSGVSDADNLGVDIGVAKLRSKRLRAGAQGHRSESVKRHERGRLLLLGRGSATRGSPASVVGLDGAIREV